MCSRGAAVVADGCINVKLLGSRTLSKKYYFLPQQLPPTLRIAPPPPPFLWPNLTSRPFLLGNSSWHFLLHCVVSPGSKRRRCANAMGPKWPSRRNLEGARLRQPHATEEKMTSSSCSLRPLRTREASRATSCSAFLNLHLSLLLLLLQPLLS